MKTAVVTDGKYRASLAAVRALGAAGFRVALTQNESGRKLSITVYQDRKVSVDIN